MRLRLALVVTLLLTLVLTAGRLVVLVEEQAEADLLRTQQAALNEMANTSARLLVVTQDFLLHEQPRAVVQWNLLQQELTASMNGYARTSEVARTAVAPMMLDAEAMPLLFQRLIGLRQEPASDVREASIDLLVSQLINDTRRISEGALELAQNLDERRTANARSHSWQDFAYKGILLTLVLALSWVIVWRLMRPLRLLASTAQAVQAGQAAQRTGYRARDEMGMATQAFDEMIERLAAREARLQAASEAKSRFLANMSHEIRTPLHALIGIQQLLEDSPMGLEQRRLLERSRTAGQSLLGIINDVLDLAKIEAGEMTLNPQDVGVDDLLQHTLDLFDTQAQERGIALELWVDPALPPRLVLDRQRLEQVLKNLLSNALKFTDRGRVRLSVHVQTDGDALRLWAEVSDTGIGIPADQCAHLFDPFYQADNSSTRAFGGTGLGLSIVRELVTLMGGDVGVQSEPGRGSRFWFTARTRLPDAVGLAAPDTAPLLVIGACDPHRLDALRTQAERVTAAVRCFDQPRDLVRWLAERQTQGHALPDALLLGWDSHNDACLQLMNMLRRELPLAQRPPLLAACGSDAERDTLHATGAPVAAVLVEPLSAAAITGALRRARHLTRRLRQADEAVSQPLLGVHCLVVDDSDINLDIASRLLGQRGARVTTASGGEQALALLASVDLAVDVVLMDLQMPGMDGYETTRRLRQLPGRAQLPVIALTAAALLQERERAVACGMNGFLTKPLELDDLLGGILRHLPVRGEPLAKAVTGRVDDTSAPDLDLPGIDPVAWRLRLGNDETLFHSALKRFLTEWAALGSEGGAPLPPTDTLARQMHRLRGTAGLIGADGMAALALDIEREALQGRAAPQAWAQLCRALRALMRAHAALGLQGRAAGAPAASPIDPRQVADLRRLLREQDLSALDLFQRMEPQLRHRWGAGATEALHQSIHQLDFAGALAHLPPD